MSRLFWSCPPWVWSLLLYFILSMATGNINLVDGQRDGWAGRPLPAGEQVVVEVPLEPRASCKES